LQYDLLPTAPGAIIGFTSRGPIRLLAGGSGDDDTTDATGGDSGQADAQQGDGSQADTGSSASGSDDRQDNAGAKKDPPKPAGRDDDKTARTIAAIREDFKTERTKRQEAEAKAAEVAKRLDEITASQQAQMDALARAFGVKKDDTPPDPEQLVKEFEAKLTEAQAETEAERKKAADGDAARRDTEIRLAVYQNAGKHGGDGDALLDSASFLRAVSKLDPAADDFSDQLGEAITKAVEGNPRLRKPEKPTPGKSGTEHTPSPVRKREARGIAAAVSKAYRT
jgi:hypothetical protein